MSVRGRERAKDTRLEYGVFSVFLSLFSLINVKSDFFVAIGLFRPFVLCVLGKHVFSIVFLARLLDT